MRVDYPKENLSQKNCIIWPIFIPSSNALNSFIIPIIKIAPHDFKYRCLFDTIDILMGASWSIIRGGGEDLVVVVD